jgi:hypothetical protein
LEKLERDRHFGGERYIEPLLQNMFVGGVEPTMAFLKHMFLRVAA